jgi:hypothetical protein
VLTAACLFLGLAALFAATRSHWLDDWDSVNFAFGLDDFDVTKHWPHPPGYPVYIAAGKLVYRVTADHAGALTLVSALSGGAVASMFYVLERRHSDWPVALCATLIMALSPMFWLQSGLALTDMFGMVFVVAFLLVEGATTTTPPVAGLEWVKTNRPDAILYSGSLRRHAEFYWREGKTVAEPKTEADCIEFRKALGSGRPVLSTNSQLCGIDGTKLVEFKRDARIHDKHHYHPDLRLWQKRGRPGLKPNR